MATAMNPFKKATRAKTRLRMALCGPAGSGKSYTALRFATTLRALLEEQTGREIRIAAIDSENGSLSKYVGEREDDMEFDFDCSELQNYSPSSYVQMIKLAEEAGYDIIVIDSLSHAWTGTGGALDMVDKKKASGKNAFTDGWREVTPMHNAMIDAIVNAKMHVIATMRTKTEWVMETDARGKVVPRKIGLAPVQRSGLEYEFDVVGDIDQETHTLTVTKSRCKAIDNAMVTRPGAAFFMPIFHWLQSGSDIPREVIEAAGFKQKEEPMTPLERAKRQREEAAKRKAEQEQQAATESGNVETSGVERQPISDATRANIRTLIGEICPERGDAIKLSESLLANYGVATVAELSEGDGMAIHTTLLGMKSEKLLRDSAAKLQASGTAMTVDYEPSVVKPKPVEEPKQAEPPAAATATPEAVAESEPPSADESGDARDLSSEPGTATKEQITHCQSIAEKIGWKYEKQQEYLAAMKCKSFRNLSESQMDELIQKLEKRLAAASQASAA